MPLTVPFLSSLRSSQPRSRSNSNGEASTSMTPLTTNSRPTRFISAAAAAASKQQTPVAAFPFLDDEDAQQQTRSPPLTRQSFDVAPRLTRRQSSTRPRRPLLGFYLSPTTPRTGGAGAGAAGVGPNTTTTLSTVNDDVDVDDDASRTGVQASTPTSTSTSNVVRRVSSTNDLKVQAKATQPAVALTLANAENGPGTVTTSDAAAAAALSDMDSRASDANPLKEILLDVPTTTATSTASENGAASGREPQRSPALTRRAVNKPTLRITTFWPAKERERNALETRRDDPHPSRHHRGQQHISQQLHSADLLTEFVLPEASSAPRRDLSAQNDPIMPSRRALLRPEDIPRTKVAFPVAPQQPDENHNKWKRQGFIETLAPPLPPKRPARQSITTRDSTTDTVLSRSSHSDIGASSSALQRSLTSSDTDEDNLSLGGSSSDTSDSLDDEDDYYEHTIVTAKRCTLSPHRPKLLHTMRDIMAASRACSSASTTSPIDLPSSCGPELVHPPSFSHEHRPSIFETMSSSDSLSPKIPEQHKTAPLKLSHTSPSKSSAPAPPTEALTHTERARLAAQERSRQREQIPFEVLRARVDSIEARHKAEELARAMAASSQSKPRKQVSPLGGPLPGIRDVVTLASDPSTPETGTSGSPAPPNTPSRYSSRVAASILRHETNSGAPLPSPRSGALGLSFGPAHSGPQQHDGFSSASSSRSRTLRTAVSTEALRPQPPPAARPRRLQRASGDNLSSAYHLAAMPPPPPSRSEPANLVSSPSRSETSLPLSSEAVMGISFASTTKAPSPCPVPSSASGGTKLKHSVMTFASTPPQQPSAPPSNITISASSADTSYTANRARGASVSSHASEGRSNKSRMVSLLAEAVVGSGGLDDNTYKPSGRERASPAHHPSARLKSSTSFTHIREMFEDQLAAELCGSSFMSRRPSSPGSSMAVLDAVGAPAGGISQDDLHAAVAPASAAAPMHSKPKSKTSLRLGGLKSDFFRSSDHAPVPGPTRSPSRRETFHMGGGGSSGGDNSKHDRYDSSEPSRPSKSTVRIKEADGTEHHKSRPSTPETTSTANPSTGSGTGGNSPKSRWWKRSGKRASQLGKSFPSIKNLGGSGSSSGSATTTSSFQQGPEPLIISSPLSPVQTPGTPTRMSASTSAASDTIPLLRSPLGTVSPQDIRLMDEVAPLITGRSSSSRGTGVSAEEPQMVASSSDSRVTLGHHASQTQQQLHQQGQQQHFRDVYGRPPPSSPTTRDAGSASSSGPHHRSSFTGHRLPYWPSFGSRRTDLGPQPASDGCVPGQGPVPRPRKSSRERI